jgi:putative ABC transport system permease protein
MFLRLAHHLIQDFRYGLRSIKRSKGIALGVVISMALGVGATASIFSLVDSILYRPLPVPETDRVVHITNTTSARFDDGFSYPEYRDYVERNQTLSGIASYNTTTVGLAPNLSDEPRVTAGLLVSGNFFSTLKLALPVGRGFLPEEDLVSGRDAVAVISYSEWQRDFGGAADIVGRTIAINGRSFTVVGVTPEDFLGVMPVVEPQIYIPRMMTRQVFPGEEDTSFVTNRSARSVALLARLKPQVTVEQARDDIERIARQLESEHPETNKGIKATVLTQGAYKKLGRPPDRLAVVLFTLVSLVLVIACVNVSNLLLSTIPARTREMAVKVAMGAPRRRLVQQLLIEGITLSSAGTLVGLGIASWSARFISSIHVGASDWLHLQARVDERVVIFGLAVGLVSAFISGAIPAWRCSRSDLNSLLKSADPQNRPHKIRGRQMFVAVQVAAASLILVVSGLFLKELQIAATQNPGFRVDHVLSMVFNPSIAGYDRQKAHAFYHDVVERVRAMPGVKSAAIAQDKPFGTVNTGLTSLTIEGYEMPANQPSIDIRSSAVGDGYFETLGIPIIRGRAFDRRDGVNAPRTIIVNETMAQRYWPNRDPLGARVDIKSNGEGTAEVIGIARNSKYAAMNEPRLSFLYRSYDQSANSVAALLVETDGAPENLTSAIRSEIRDIAPNVPIFDVRTMQDQVLEVGLLDMRLTAQILTAVGIVGLVLGVVGLYAVIAYSVGQRTYEIGIRMAVGASNSQILKMVLLKGLSSSVVAAVVGITLALALSGTMTNIVSYVNPRDPAIYISVLVVMLSVTALAGYIPARRASKVDPNITLRA